MSNTIFKYMFCSLMILAIIQPVAQAQSARVRNADRYYDNYLYSEAIIRYERVPKKKKDAHVLRRLAQSYYLTGDYQRAEKYYNRLMTEYPDQLVAEDYWNYGDVLRMNDKYAEAYPYVQQYASLRADEIRTSGQMRDPYYYNELREDKGQFAIRRLKNNTDESDWGTSYDGDKVVFVSSRHGGKVVNYEYDWNEKGFYDLYQAKKHPRKDDRLKGIKCMHAKGGLNGRFHEGPATFSPDGNLMIFTRNSYVKRKELNAAKIRQLELWYCVKDEHGKWGRMQPLPFNSKEYSVGHPALTADGNTLYFVSDMPGGYGATDIYYSHRNGDGTWGPAINAGSLINTEGKEMFPYHHSDGMLFFASNGHPGLGGLDVYVASAKTDRIGRPKNVGSPVNGPQDDFAFVLDRDMKDGYFSSNRAGGRGSDDIYAYDLLKPFQLNKKLEGYTKDAKSGDILTSTRVQLMDEKNNLVEEIFSDNSGYYSFEVESDMNYTLKGTHDKYKEVTKTVSTATDEDVITADLLLDKIPEITLVVSVTDIKSKLPIEGVHVTVQDKDQANNVLASLYTNEAGTAREPLNERLLYKKINYTIRFEKEGYVAKTINFVHTIDKEGEVRVATTLGKLELGTDIGKLIDINPIYFDYNKWNIRPDAAIELDRIVAVMKAYPDIEIELGSHTDCRGSKKYNMNLSDKRAKSSATYIISKGISKDRIYGKGYGESRLVNKCECEGKVKSSCSEEEHAMNRRTEFIIVKINVPQSTQK
jgi:outer membrane protein OmpA-like peptidoglycan-associated protein/tetratricopeptide (TPR) repeat protein